MAGGKTTIVLLMVRDAYANYVVQTTLDVVPESEEKRLLLEELNSHADELVSVAHRLLHLFVCRFLASPISHLSIQRQYTFAKHIVAKLGTMSKN